MEKRHRRLHVGAPGDGREGGLRLVDDVRRINVPDHDQHEPVRVAERAEVRGEVLGLEPADRLDGADSAVRVGVPCEGCLPPEEAQATVAVFHFVTTSRELALLHDVELTLRERRSEESLDEDREELVPDGYRRLRRDGRIIVPRVTAQGRPEGGELL